MSISKLTFLLVTLCLGVQSLGGTYAEVVCMTIVDEDGTERKGCAYTEDPHLQFRYAFINHMLGKYWSETSYYGDYESLSQLNALYVTSKRVYSCDEARSHVSKEGGEFERGFSCRTDQEIQNEMFEKAENEVLGWFLMNRRCHVTVDGAGMLTGIGALRAIAKGAIKKLSLKIESSVTDKQLKLAQDHYVRTNDAKSAFAGLAGLVIGETINDWVCDQVAEMAGVP